MTPDHRHHTSQGSARSRFHRLEGAALIIVLSCLVLVTALIIGFLSRAQTERGNSASYRGGMGSRNLADYAVNIVMAQIRAATTGTNAANAWASQPGAIRVYSSTGNSLVNFYKLYSATNNMVGGSVSDLMSDTNLSGWSVNTALYTDLNAPVVTGSGAAVQTNYPILDPGALGVVQGFTNDIVAGVNSASNPVPMPVAWLYVLENGTLVAPTGSGNTANVTNAASTNPIVGRIAFWTDDDTCKININTASGAPWNYTNTTVTTTWGETKTVPMPANYWDTPVIGSDQDRNLAISQPWAGEYQRFPGHPATVSLSAVFTNLTTNDIMAIAPRITYQNGGFNVGSQWGGFVATNGANSTASVTVLDPPSQTATRMSDDASRLYANVDELLFATNRSATGTNPVTPRQIELGRFFLTASSRAPDVTLFNTPRILCWPITFTSGNTNKMTPYDQLIAFCGTVGSNTTIGGPNSYYFTRWDSLSATADYNANSRLLGYFRRMTTTAVPGFGGSSGILGKYNSISPGESEQITTEIFDYIRCINSMDTSMETNPIASLTNQYTYAVSNSIMPTAGANNTRGFGRFPTITKVGMHFWFNNYFITTNAGQTNINVSLCARLLMEPFHASHGYPNPHNFNTHRFVISGLQSLRWGTNSSSMTQIFPNDTTNARLASTGRSYGGRHFYFLFKNTSGQPIIATSPTNASPAATLFCSQVITNRWTNGTNILPAYPESMLFTNTFSFSGGTLTIAVTDARTPATTNQVITVTLPPISSLPLPLSTFGTNWNGSNSSFNGPNAWNVTPPPWTNNVAMILTNGTATNQSGSLIPREQQEPQASFCAQDVVRAVAVSHGDFRLIAANTNVPTNAFVTVDGGVGAYTSSDPNQRLAHNFVGEHPYTAPGARFPRGNYYNTNNTNFTRGTTNAPVALQFGPTNSIKNVRADYRYTFGDPAIATNTALTGDFDNGYGEAADGPYIGFPDEGNIRMFRFRYSSDPPTTINYSIPYLDGYGTLMAGNGGSFSPNRLVPSAGIMGSLPTGVRSQTPWQTLLFRPAALIASTNHPGRGMGNQAPTSANQAADCLLLDLFNMPVVEPYAISEPLSTAGRVNMNYQILPFTYIKRSTALQAALHTERLVAIPNTQSGTTLMNQRSLKQLDSSVVDIITNRFAINLSTNDGTLRGFENRFGSNDIFRSAAEICSIPLVPTNSNWSSVTSTNPSTAFWPNYSLTGDNTKERPYARIYPKLTTKSNTYTIHYRVEVLKKRPNSKATDWIEGQDKVLSTYRGSTTIERYVNPRDPALPDYASLTLPVTGANALPNFYKFRVVGERQFNP
jgi:uncharacterized protein (TIGR02600 family)